MATIIIGLLIVMWLAYLVPWYVQRRNQGVVLDIDEITEQFSLTDNDLNKIDLTASAESDVDISTPLTRRAELAELRNISRTAAKRRRITLAVLLLITTGLLVAWGFQLLPWWPALIPAGLIVLFLGIARFSVVAMQRRLDARAAALIAGWDEETDFLEIKTEVEDSISMEMSMDLSAPQGIQGSLWEAIPVTAPNYVSKPLAPRTVRTIDLTAPVMPAPQPVVPTADPLAETAALNMDEVTEEMTRLKAVGE